MLFYYNTFHQKNQVVFVYFFTDSLIYDRIVVYSMFSE